MTALIVSGGAVWTAAIAFVICLCRAACESVPPAAVREGGRGLPAPSAAGVTAALAELEDALAAAVPFEVGAQPGV